MLLLITTLTALLVSACGGVAAASTETSVGSGKPQASLIEFTGVVEAIDGDQWTINGQVVTIDPSVLRDGPFDVGDTVKVEAEVQDDGSVVVTRVEQPAAATNDNTNDDNSNANVNANSNDNSNTNTNGNSNSNSNDNTNDDNGNDDNSNDDDNGNDDNSNDDDDNGNDDNSNDDDDNGNDDSSNDDSGSDDDDDSSGGDNDNLQNNWVARLYLLGDPSLRQ